MLKFFVGRDGCDRTVTQYTYIDGADLVIRGIVPSIEALILFSDSIIVSSTTQPLTLALLISSRSSSSRIITLYAQPIHPGPLLHLNGWTERPRVSRISLR